MVSRDEYVLSKIKSLVDYSNQNDVMINPIHLAHSIKLWSIDYQAESIERRIDQLQVPPPPKGPKPRTLSWWKYPSMKGE